MEGLPTNVVAEIMSYIHFNRRYRDSLLSYRLVSRRFNSAITSFRPLWLEFLNDKGPMMIGPDSKHRPGSDRCKISSKTGKCHIFTHYHYRTLIPRYNTDDAYNAYKTVIKLRRSKQTKHVEALIRSNKRSQERLEEKYFQNKRKLEEEHAELERKLQRYK